MRGSAATGERPQPLSIRQANSIIADWQTLKPSGTLGRYFVVITARHYLLSNQQRIQPPCAAEQPAGKNYSTCRTAHDATPLEQFGKAINNSFQIVEVRSRQRGLCTS
jgi:hypothetical protein